jgi:hypothetical protein
MTLTEYLNIIKCDDEQKPTIDPERMTPEYMAQLEDRTKQNQEKRKADSTLADIKEFVNG